jgi:hypothetical protein
MAATPAPIVARPTSGSQEVRDQFGDRMAGINPRNRSRMVSPRGASTGVASDRPPASFLWNRVVGAPASVKLAGQYETPILSVINAFETV